ncbi:hypothetical protein WEB32_29605 [Streptomyces netropsis]|uniref:Type IV secretory pathway VirB10-like protein n=1 Tax=Streptomyces netropsis TaxID=55404 RepID=A0A7W7PBX0_STRNE|nr:hypothetical protein [Streptomyces netropsis]MBB4885051.1 type IV secretory pathway VirB10-like protein [Streptomyces netropsis]
MIGAVAVIIAAVIGAIFSPSSKSNGSGNKDSSVSAGAQGGTSASAEASEKSTPDEPTRAGVTPTTPKPTPSVSGGEKSMPPSSKARWKGTVTLPLTLNANSDVGADFDGKDPGRLVGVDDDLRGDYSASAAVMVMTGRAAEAPGDAGDLRRSDCEKRLPPGVTQNPVSVPLTRSNGVSGTYCFTTTEGRTAAFSMVSANLPLPDAVTIKVVLWE